MTIIARVGIAAALSGSVVLLGSCQRGITGPTLTATVQNLSLQPTVAGLQGGQNVCCCHLAGQVTNTSPVAIHAELRFPAKGPTGLLVGTALDIQRDMQPGQTRSFLAVGIPAACRDINLAQINAEKEIRIKGLWEPE